MRAGTGEWVGGGGLKSSDSKPLPPPLGGQECIRTAKSTWGTWEVREVRVSKTCLLSPAVKGKVGMVRTERAAAVP